ncbi:radical SAM protein [Shewanella oncorhynchi]|uniref:radical SAM protein n=1 Tax=Shewanella oncorhynchi TaxID=2726434 RepID=UPI0039F0B258
MDLYKNIFNQQPKTLTLIPTYRCTAACKECCFESNQNLKTTLNHEEMIASIDEAYLAFPDLLLVVFTGGECFTLKEILYKSISHATEKGLKTRCVTNGYWAKLPSKANEIANKISDSGLTEINFSTGVDHQQYVDEQTIINAISACSKYGIKTLVTIEKDTFESSCRRSLESNEAVANLVRSGKLIIQSNTWMPFKSDYVDRGDQISKNDLRSGCEQIFENIVITPHGRISSCCGLTFEHIPEMKIGKIGNVDSLKNAYINQQNDFLKIWIKMDGPYSIVEKLMGADYIDKNIGTVSHGCQACVYLHKDRKIVDAVKENYTKFIPNVLLRYRALQSLQKKLT